MQPSSLRPGSRLAGRRLVLRLGIGGEGEVWLAERPDGSRCALKVIRPSMLPAPEEVRRRGAWLVRIDHPALVHVSRGGRFTAGELDGWGFVEMDLVDGPSLQEADPLPGAVDLLLPVAEGLDRLHAGTWSDGIPLVHRDVKPGNLIDAPSGLVLVDPSTMRGLDTSDLTRVGTPVYVAPEVASGRFGPAADVYSLCATAAALLTGARGPALGDLLDDPWSAGLPPGVAAGLALDPRDRPPGCVAALRSTAPPAPARHRRSGSDDGSADQRQHPPHAHDAGHDSGERRAWPLPVLAALLGTLASAGALRPAGASPLPAPEVAGAVAAVHLVVHLLTRRPVMGLLAPMWAWGDLMAQVRTPAHPLVVEGPPSPERARGPWLSDVVAGVLVLLTAGWAAALAAGLRPWVPIGLVVLAVCGIAIARVQSASPHRSVWTIAWVMWLPARLAGGIPRRLVGGQGADLP